MRSKIKIFFNRKAFDNSTAVVPIPKAEEKPFFRASLLRTLERSEELDSYFFQLKDRLDEFKSMKEIAYEKRTIGTTK